MPTRLLCLLLFWVAVPGAFAATDASAGLADALGIGQLLRAMPDNIRRQVAHSAVSHGLDAPAQEVLLTAVQTALPLARIRADIDARLAAEDIGRRSEQLSLALSAVAIGTVSALVNLPADEGSLQTLQAYRERLASEQVSSARLAAVDRLLAADGSLAFSILVQTAITECVSVALATIPGIDVKATDASLAQRQRAGIDEALGNLARDYHLFALRHQETVLLDAYAEAWQAPELQWLLEIADRELRAALRCRESVPTGN